LKKIIYILFILLFCFVFKLNAQNYTLSLENNSDKDNKMIKKLNYKKHFYTKTEREKEIKNILFWLYNNSYITARFDSIIEDSLNLSAYLFVGNKYTLASVNKGNVDKTLLSEVGYKENFYSPKAGKVFQYKEIRTLIEKILIFCENNGYPFALIKLDSISIDSNCLQASLNLNKNLKINIDSIIIKGNAKISNTYLYSYLGIKPKNIYNESKINKINTRLKELQFVKKTKPIDIIFVKNDAKILLYIDKKNVSQFNGILGVLPNNRTGKILLNGDVHLKLLNSFGKGELIDFNWRKIEQNTQNLKTNFVLPFILSTPFGIDFKFSIYKKDTSYLNINSNIGIQYLFKGNNYIKVFLDNRKSSLVSTTGLKNITVLPSYADISTMFYGLELNNEKLDYGLNPRKGYQIKLSAAAGNKNIKKNDKINPDIYDKLKLSTTQYKIESDFGVFLPLFQKNTIFINIKSAIIDNPNLFENELYRIGGLKTLRGFDEESINASLYSILNIEYRYLLEQNSYIYLFWNGAYYENKSVNPPEVSCDRPYGFGAGISFETKIGIFSINYALGKQFNNPIYFKSAKIHFGVVNYF
jgi:outer membrane protein assembly factor BamA